MAVGEAGAAPRGHGRGQQSSWSNGKQRTGLRGMSMSRTDLVSHVPLGAGWRLDWMWLWRQKAGDRLEIELRCTQWNLVTVWLRGMESEPPISCLSNWAVGETIY